LLEVLALDVDHGGAATVDRSTPGNLLRDPQSLLRAAVILLSRIGFRNSVGPFDSAFAATGTREALLCCRLPVYQVAAEGSPLGSLAFVCAVGGQPAVAGIRAEPAACGAVPRARAGMSFESFGRRVISCGWSGLASLTRAFGGLSVGTAAIPPSPGSSWAERIGARPSPVLLVCGSRSRSPSLAWEPMARCSGRLGWPICTCGQLILRAHEGLRANANERATRYRRPGKEGPGVTEAAKERCAHGKNGQNGEAEAEEEDRARKVSTADGRPERRAPLSAPRRSRTRPRRAKCRRRRGPGREGHAVDCPVPGVDDWVPHGSLASLLLGYQPGRLCGAA
jgi:hypothetical protein